MTLFVGALLARGLTTRPDAPAATLGSEAVTFAELHAGSDRRAALLMALGVRRGSIVAWISHPALVSLEIFLACARIGAVFAPVNPKLGEAELSSTLQVLNPDQILLGPGARDRAAEARAHAPTADWQEAGAAWSTPPPGPLADSEPHIAYLTSGSTGTPKAVLVSHRASWLRSAPGGGTFTRPLRGTGGVVCTFPLYHYGGWHYVMESWQHGRAVHLVERADAPSVAEAVTTWQPTALYCIPAVWERVLDERGTDLSCLEYADTGTSTVSRDLVRRIKRRLPHTTTTILYGSTEVGRMAALPDWELETHPGSVGCAAFPTMLSLAHDGEVLANSPAMMNGYLGRPDLTAEVLDEHGTYRTGDIGLFHDEHLHLTGRRSEMIRSGGEFVSPLEVETALRAVADVRDLAVVGVPDPTWGEIVCAVVVPGPGGPPELAALQDSTRVSLAPHKRPRRLVVLPELPRTSATGQVQRRKVAELVREC